MSKGYWVVRANVNDADEYSKYIQIATNIIEKYDGRFLIRGGDQIEYEESGYERTVVVEFNSFEDALDCYNSHEYQSALGFVKNSAKRYFSVVKGI
tara:strand:+ start:721 stop:1008 length:288 start_codon:yes stop_codon:yes gene_type:complete